ncbi:hypothetical protein EN873_13775 [bacterium M00.F.Ca.ET.230.01.1.1]|nr:hypothetical protein EN873_13775 [bacterium M00.F.Ca.ET.230.01.1.1]
MGAGLRHGRRGLFDRQLLKESAPRGAASPNLQIFATDIDAIAALVDVSSHKEAEGSQERLLHELQHRVKNILATITALTSRMVRMLFRKGDAAPG